MNRTKNKYREQKIYKYAILLLFERECNWVLKDITLSFEIIVV